MLSNRFRAFGLIELIVVIFIVSVALAGMITIIVRILAYAHLIASRLEAGYLAQEGIELVRNIRDDNWLVGRDWDQGIETGVFEIDYNDAGLSLWQGQGRYLGIKNSFYAYDQPNEPTKFKRQINIQKRINLGTEPDEIRLCVLVFWQQLQKDYEVEVCSRLYDWQRGFGLQ